MKTVKKIPKKQGAKKEWSSLYDPATKEWYFRDKNNHLWVCDDTQAVCIDITLNDYLVLEGEARELTRTIAQLRRQLNLKEGEPLPEFKVVD